MKDVIYDEKKGLEYIRKRDSRNSRKKLYWVGTMNAIKGQAEEII